jgi:hypothetical protein
VANWGRSGTVEWNLINHRFGQNFTDLENRIALKNQDFMQTACAGR